MKRNITSVLVLLLILLSLTGCSDSRVKTADLTVIYGAAVVLSLVLLIGYCCLIKKRNAWFVLLFSSVLVVNIGYFCLAISTSLSEALLANRIAYLGSVLLPMSMLMIILKVTNIKYPRYIQWLLLGISLLVFFVAASPGYLDIYYKEVSFAIVNGVSTLVKVYGSWHGIYWIYLLLYFFTMVAVIICAGIKKNIDSTAHAMILAIAVFVNLSVWLLEQLVRLDFEMLSVSYIISECFLLGIHLVVNENQRLRDIVEQEQSTVRPEIVEQCAYEKAPYMEGVSEEAVEQFQKGLGELTPKERTLFDAYIAGKATKEILVSLNIKENTLKFHSKNLYAKLGVNSRKQLVAVFCRLENSERQ